MAAFKNHKFQAPNHREITNYNVQNHKRIKSCLKFEIWDLEFICNLVLGIWDFTLCFMLFIDEL